TDGDQSRTITARKDGTRELEISARFRPRLFFHLNAISLRRAKNIDLRSNHRPHRQEERKRGKTEQIAGAPLGVERGVESRVRVSLEPALGEIHEQKGKVIKDVDRGERIVEFDRIEQDGLAFDLDDVAQVEIAVTVADIAAPRPRFEEPRRRRK